MWPPTMARRLKQSPAGSPDSQWTGVEGLPPRQPAPQRGEVRQGLAGRARLRPGAVCVKHGALRPPCTQTPGQRGEKAEPESGRALGGFPGGPVVKTQRFHCRGCGLDFWSKNAHMPRGVTNFSKKVKKGLGQHDQESGVVLFFWGGRGVVLMVARSFESLKLGGRCVQLCDLERIWQQTQERAKGWEPGAPERLWRNSDDRGRGWVGEIFSTWMTVLSSFGAWVIWILGFVGG